MNSRDVVTIAFAVTGFAGCGSEAAETGTNSNTPAGTTAGAQCPGAPSSVVFQKVAPVWGGLIIVEAKVPKGEPDNLDMQVLDPNTTTWVPGFGQNYQKNDGTFQIYWSPRVNDANKDKSFKVRVRARLGTCTPSGWTESEEITLKNPLSGTKWIAAGDIGDVATTFRANLTSDAYTIAAISNVIHEVSFGTDGNMTERWSYDIKTNAPGAPYDRCHIDLNYAGQWALSFQSGSMRLSLGDRMPVPGGASASRCGSPAVADFYFNQSQTIARLVAASLYFGATYEELAYTIPGKAQFTNAALFSAMTNTLVDISARGGLPSVTGSLPHREAIYVRQ